MAAKANARSGRRWSRLLIWAIITYTGFMCAAMLNEHYAIHKETGATKARMVQLQEQNQILQQERDLLKTPAYVEKVARDELGMAKPGEVPYIPAKN